MIHRDIQGRGKCIAILQIGDVCCYGTCAFRCACACVLGGFYSCCIFKYDFVLCMYIYIYIRTYIYIYIQSVPRFKVTTSGECSFVKIYRYNPKHLYPKLNGYGDNGQRKLLTSCISAYCTSSAINALTLTEQCSRPLCECTSYAQHDKIVLHYCRIFMLYVQCLVTLRTTMT